MNTGKYLTDKCGYCNRLFVLSKWAIDDLEGSGKMFCSKTCYKYFCESNTTPELLELDDIIYHECPSCGQGCSCLDQPCSHHHEEQ